MSGKAGMSSGKERVETEEGVDSCGDRASFFFPPAAGEDY